MNKKMKTNTHYGLYHENDEANIIIHNKDYGLRYFCTKLWISHASNEEIIEKIINLEDKVVTLKLMLKDRWDKLL